MCVRKQSVPFPGGRNRAWSAERQSDLASDLHNPLVTALFSVSSLEVKAKNDGKYLARAELDLTHFDFDHDAQRLMNR